MALTDDGDGATSHTVVGPGCLTGEDCAATWGRALDTQVRFTGDVADWQEAMSSRPKWILYDLGLMYGEITVNGMLGDQADVDTVTALLGRPPRSYEFFVEEFVAARSG